MFIKLAEGVVSAPILPISAQGRKAGFAPFHTRPPTTRAVADGLALPRTNQDQSRCGNLISRTDLRPGDLIFLVTLKEKQVDHVGIYLGDTKFVHASYSKGVVVSSLLQDYYVQRYHSARRVVP